ncbi:hypothetical protein OIO90_006631, partial [Microbotryomycetes sp. JL221]
MDKACLDTVEGNPRTRVAQVVANYAGLSLEFVDTKPFGPGGVGEEYKSKYPLGLVPAFEKGDFSLTESVAIAYYLANQNEQGAALLGKNKEDAAKVQQWVEFANMYLLTSLGAWFGPILGMEPYNKAGVERAKEKVTKAAAILEDALKTRTFLVGDRLSLADIFVASVLGRGFERVLDPAFRKSHVNIVRHFNTVIHQKPFFDVLGGEPPLCDKAIEYVPPKKEAKPAAAPKAEAPKPAAAAPAAPAAAAGDDEAAPAPKP